MKSFWLFLIILISTSLSFFAADITGSVEDSDNLPLPGATVKLINPEDSVTKAVSVTDIDGLFIFMNQNEGKYIATASMTGLEPFSKSFTVAQDDSVVNIGNFVLTENAVTLQEAVVTAIKSAIVAKEDTIEYNAGSFHTSTNAKVDELLKKLPGVEVSSDGSITANGKNVSKILVDGKEFFNDDPQMATKNLLSDMVDKVQVIDRKSDLARLTGVDDGEEETVINLTVKKNMKNGWFGSVTAGYGTDDRYAGDFVVNNFSNGNQVTILGGLNNINENGFSDRGRGRFRDFGASGGITTAQRLGLNFNVGNEDIFRVGGNILFSHSETKFTKKSATQFLFPDSVSYQDAGSRNIDKGYNLNADLRLQWKIDPFNTLDFRPRLSMNFRNSESNDSSLLFAGDPMRTQVNRNINAKNNRGTSFQTSGNLIFNHNFENRPGRSFSINAQYSFSNTVQKSVTWNDIQYFLLNEEDEEIYRFLDTDNKMNSMELRLSWTEPLGNAAKGHYLNFAYRLQYKWNNSDLYTYDLPFPESLNGFMPPQLNNPPENAIFDPDLSNSFRNKFLNQELQIGYKKISKDFNLDAGLLFSPSSSKSEDLINSARNIPRRNVFNVSPYANIRYKFGERSSLRFNYRARTSQPSMTQLQPVPDVSDPLNVIIGNPELKPTFTQNIGLHFNDYRVTHQQTLAVFLNASYTLNNIVARTITDPSTGGRTTTYANVNGNFNITGTALFSRPFNNRKWRFNIRLMSRYNSAAGYINGDYNRTGNLNLSPSGGLTFSSEIFQISLNPTYSFSSTKNTLPRQTDRLTHSYGFTSDASLYLPFGLDITTDLSFSNSTGYARGFNSRQWIWNAKLSYSFLTDKSLTLSLKIYDLLGEKKNISRTISANSIIDSAVNDLTRYFMLSLTWNFNSLSKKNKTNSVSEGLD